MLNPNCAHVLWDQFWTEMSSRVTAGKKSDDNHSTVEISSIHVVFSIQYKDSKVSLFFFYKRLFLAFFVFLVVSDQISLNILCQQLFMERFVKKK